LAPSRGTTIATGAPAALALPSFGAGKRLAIILVLSLGLSTPIIVWPISPVAPTTATVRVLEGVSMGMGSLNTDSIEGTRR